MVIGRKCLKEVSKWAVVPIIARHIGQYARRDRSRRVQGPLAIDLSVGRVVIEGRQRSSQPEGTDARTTQARLPAARSAYLANTRDAFLATAVAARGPQSTLYA